MEVSVSLPWFDPGVDGSLLILTMAALHHIIKRHRLKELRSMTAWINWQEDTRYIGKPSWSIGRCRMKRACSVT